MSVDIRVTPFCGANSTYPQLEEASEHVKCSLPNRPGLVSEVLFEHRA